MGNFATYEKSELEKKIGYNISDYIYERYKLGSKKNKYIKPSGLICLHFYRL